MKYYLNLFSPATFTAFLNSDKTITGFSINQKGHAKKIQPGDRFICYVTKVSRFFGLLEVLEGPFVDDKPIFVPENDPFVLRFKVKPHIILPIDNSLPIKEDIIWNKLSFTKNAEKSKTYTWAYNLQGSLSELKIEDSKHLVQMLESQRNDPVKYFLDHQVFNKYKNAPMKRADDKVVEITVPDESTEPEEQKSNESVRKSHQIQAQLAELGEKLGFRIWIAKSDRNAVQQIWKSNDDILLDDLSSVGIDSNALNIVKLIDVLWIKGRSIVRAFEVEETTTIFSGLLRMTDLLTLSPNLMIKLHIVASEKRWDKYYNEVNRPTFAFFHPHPVSELCNFISYESLETLMSMKHIEHAKDSIIDEYSTSSDSTI